MNRNAEVLCVGTELLLGQILNTNAQYLANELARLGIPHYFQTVVGDNKTRLHQALRVAEDRAGVLVLTGGLGPTPDDLTHESLASYFGVPLVEPPGLWADLQAKFQSRGRVATVIQRKQCQLPRGARVLPNSWGTAVGVCWEAKPGLHILTFPGVPQEMTRMWQATAVPYLQNLGWGQQVITSRLLRFWGVGEATLAQRVQHLLGGENPTVAPYAQGGEVQLRVTACAANEAAAHVLMAPVISELKTLAGLDYFGMGEETLPGAVGALLTQHGQTVAVAESCTGGLVGQLLSGVVGSSHYFQGGVIAYADKVKTDLLGVDAQLITQVGAVSPGVAQQMALGVQQLLGSDWGLGLTGISGPGGGTASKPVGLVYLALVQGSSLSQREYRFGSNQSRDFIRRLSAYSALDVLRREIYAKFTSRDDP
ncbi:competence/damage-inducible protein A [Candidatus Cyanaurora vandensis]|uniref:competence/damage-inducible protein A n=1 Tax=Candidatus Cyanaurora vandensis TaxID=2714958 RepID=UPI00257FE77B|nr:competence/damage-inducible protein A [Candidatus Cyanaurora vandensis]